MAIASLLLLASGACDDDNAPPLAFEDAPRELAAAYCATLFSCCDQEDFENTSHSNIALCNGEYADLFARNFQRDKFDNELGYHAGPAGSCLDKLINASCDEVHNGFPKINSCNRIFGRDIPNNSECTLNQECTSRYCVEGGPSPSAKRFCRALPEIGDLCDRRCVENAYCDSVCIPLKADGETCKFSDECIHRCLPNPDQPGGICASPLACTP